MKREHAYFNTKSVNVRQFHDCLVLSPVPRSAQWPCPEADLYVGKDADDAALGLAAISLFDRPDNVARDHYKKVDPFLGHVIPFLGQRSIDMTG